MKNAMKWTYQSLLVVLLVLSVAACAGSATRESTGEYLDNTAITAKVKAKLAASEETSALDIQVESYKGTVQLSGFVDTQAEIEAAGRIARSVDGVKRVSNRLELKGGP